MKFNLIFLCISLTLLFSCTKETETLRAEKIKDYYPLAVGKFITYQLDSTVYVKLGTQKEIHSYLIKDIIDSLTSDNLNRPTYVIRRKIRNNTDTTKWTDLTSFRVIIDSIRVEVIQDNLKFIKLASPVISGLKWKGNNYINANNISGLEYLSDWQYIYEQVRRPFIVSGISYTETISINQRNDTVGSVSNKQQYHEINYAKEIYAKSIGLIFKEFMHEVWQPPNVNSPTGYFESNSFGIKLTMINNNF